MASVVDELTDLECLRLDHSRGFDSWLGVRGIQWTRELSLAFTNRVLSASDEACAEFARSLRPPPKPAKRAPAERHRKDVPALRRFVAERPHWLTPGMQKVFELCIRDGLTLESCAAKMGVGRETVRTQLRRLRDRARASALIPR